MPRRTALKHPPTASRNETSPIGFPDAFLARLEAVMPADVYADVVRSLQTPREPGFRVNTPGAPIEVVREMRARGLPVESVAWMDNAWSVPLEHRAALLSDPAVVAGHAFVQNVSSLVPVWVLDPRPGERILDLAAAPGAKTLQIAAAMQHRGELAAVEVVRKRYYRMRALLEANGAGRFVRTFLRDGVTVPRHRPGYFDRVLLDAPCSTEGRFVAGEPDTTRYWSLRKVAEMVRRQRKLADAAIKCLKPGGTFVYSTCTTAPEENEGVVDWLLQRYAGGLTVEATRVPAEATYPPVRYWEECICHEAVGRSVRIRPDNRFEAFFVCLMTKGG